MPFLGSKYATVALAASTTFPDTLAGLKGLLFGREREERDGKEGRGASEGKEEEEKAGEG